MLPIDNTFLINQAQKDGIKKFAVGIIVTKNVSVLLLKRMANDFLPNIYEFPGGGVERDETLDQAAKRELWEETGLELETLEDYIGYFDYKNVDNIPTRIFHFCGKSSCFRSHYPS